MVFWWNFQQNFAYFFKIFHKISSKNLFFIVFFVLTSSFFKKLDVFSCKNNFLSRLICLPSNRDQKNMFLDAKSWFDAIVFDPERHRKHDENTPAERFPNRFRPKTGSDPKTARKRIFESPFFTKLTHFSKMPFSTLFGGNPFWPLFFTFEPKSRHSAKKTPQNPRLWKIHFLKTRFFSKKLSLNPGTFFAKNGSQVV